MPFEYIRLPRRIYRVSFSSDPLAYPPLSVLLAGLPGRWDDPKYRFRTGYFSDSLVTSYIELLASLRPDPAVATLLAEMGEPATDLDEAISKRLRDRYASVVIVPNEDAIVDILHARSRTEFELRARRRVKTKVGDFLGRDTRTPRRATAIVSDAGGIGIAASSAEAHAFDRTMCTFNLFEVALDRNVARVDLVAHASVRALEERIALVAARDYLGL